MELGVVLKNKSRARRLQYDWLGNQKEKISSSEIVLDLGGFPGAEYHSLLGLMPERVLTWNLNESLKPTAIVDFDKKETFPDFPKECSVVLALNLLEHLYKPLDLMEWVCTHLPPGGKFFVLVPFVYSIHPSPRDYWRITPQAFERFFDEMNAKVPGVWTVEPLGTDFREITSFATSSLFKSGLFSRMFANSVEGVAHAASAVTGSVLGKKARDKMKSWVAMNPPAIGVLWTKSQ